MTIVEGFGDEVTILLLIFLAVIVLGIAWMSTSVDSSLFIHVIVLDRDRFSALIQRIRALALRIPPNSPELNGQSGGIQEVVSPLQHGNSEGEGISGSDSVQETAEVVEQNCDVRPDVIQEVSDLDGRPDSEIRSTQLNAERIGVPNLLISPEMNTETTCEAGNSSKGVPPDQNNCEPENGEEAKTENESLPDGHIVIRLQYVDGRQRTVHARPNETIGDFKRNNFSDELGDQSVVRFIMNGQELKNENLTLDSYRVGSGSVIHCLISQVRANPTPVSNNNSQQMELGVLVFPLFGIILSVLWYARIVYRTYFNGASTFSLIAISFLYIFSLIASYHTTIDHAHPHND